jgi:hypothetical protein
VDVVVIEPDHAGFARLARALDAEADGREWENDLADELGDVLAPGVAAVRAAILSAPTIGLPHAGEPLRQAIADAVEPVVRMRGGRAGARIRVTGRGMPRGFRNAPKLFNRNSFKHPTRGGDQWATQVGAPGWFDATLRPMRVRMRQAADRALRHRAERVSRKAPG